MNQDDAFYLGKLQTNVNVFTGVEAKTETATAEQGKFIAST